MINIGAHGLSIQLIALQSFPMGFSLSQFADDVNPLDVKDTEPFGYELLYDGEMFAFDKANVIELSISVIAGSDDDINLKILLQSRKGGARIAPIPDAVTLVISYPTGTVMLTKGTILAGPLADTVLADGRKKGNTYRFAFSAFAGAQTRRELIGTITQNVVNVLR
jgi:hypothetical protein